MFYELFLLCFCFPLYDTCRLIDIERKDQNERTTVRHDSFEPCRWVESRSMSTISIHAARTTHRILLIECQTSLVSCQTSFINKALIRKQQLDRAHTQNLGVTNQAENYESKTEYNQVWTTKSLRGLPKSEQLSWLYFSRPTLHCS